MKAVLLLILFTAAVVSSSAADYYTCYKVSDKYAIKPGMDNATGLAWGRFDDSINTIGRASLYLHMSDSLSAYDGMYCNGYLESYLTHSRISEHYRLFQYANLMNYTTEEYARLEKYMSENMDYVQAQITQHAKTDNYWAHVQLLVRQVQGLVDGYSAYSTGSDVPLDMMAFWMLQSAGDLDDLESIITKNLWNPDANDVDLVPDLSRHSHEWYETHHHCSGLVKLAPDYSDIFFGQDTWSTFADLHRIVKYYDFPLNVRNWILETPTRRMTISSSPGVIVSLDDLWILDSGMLVLETTMNNFNMTLYKEYCVPQQVLCWMRVSTANRLAADGVEWSKIFPRYNSGTYNNQYFVLDLKLFDPYKKPLKLGLLTTVEMFPGPYIRILDRTAELEENTYVPSINVPFNVDLFNVAGYPGMIQQEQNEYWSYWKCARMRLIQKYHSSIITFDDYKVFMRYNNYQNDPESNNDPAEAIMSRYDLRPIECIQLNNSKMCPNTFGGLDSKAVNFTMGKYLLRMDLQVSPTTSHGLPAWEFGVGEFKEFPHYGLPALWDFPPSTFSPDDQFDACNKHSDCNACLGDPLCGWCEPSPNAIAKDPKVNGTCHLGTKQGPYSSVSVCTDGSWMYDDCRPGSVFGLPWWSIVLIIVGGTCGVVGGVFVYRRQKRVEEYVKV